MRLIIVLALSLGTTSLHILHKNALSMPHIPGPTAGESLDSYIDRTIDELLGSDNGTNDPIITDSSPSGDSVIAKRQGVSSEILSFTSNIYKQSWVDEKGNTMNATVDLTNCQYGIDRTQTIGKHVFKDKSQRDATVNDIVQDLLDIWYPDRFGTKDLFVTYTIANFELAQTSMLAAFHAGVDCSGPGTTQNENILASDIQLGRQLLAIENQDIVLWMSSFLAGGAVGASLGVVSDAIFEPNHTITAKNPVQTGLAGALLGVLGFYLAHLRSVGTYDRPAAVVGTSRSAAALLPAVVTGSMNALPRRQRSSLTAKVALLQNVIAAQLVRIGNILSVDETEVGQQCQNAEIEMGLPGPSSGPLTDPAIALDGISHDLAQIEEGLCR